MLESVHLTHVTAPVESLLEMLRKHQEAHIRAYQQACQDYVSAAISALKERLLQLEKPSAKPVNLLFHDIDPPDDHRQDYERAIGMLELHEKAGHKTIRITPDLYAAYCQDLWSWKESFLVKNIRYDQLSRKFD